MIKLKKSQAKVLIFLNTVDAMHRFARRISIKLDMDYGYLTQNLAVMHNKRWISKDRRNNKVFYNVTKEAPIEESSLLLMK